MTTPLHHLRAAQDAAEAEGGKRDDWKLVAWRLACSLATARRGVSFAFLRAGLYTDGELKPLRYDDSAPLDVMEQPVNLDKPTVI